MSRFSYRFPSPGHLVASVLALAAAACTGAEASDAADTPEAAADATAAAAAPFVESATAGAAAVRGAALETAPAVAPEPLDVTPRSAVRAVLVQLALPLAPDLDDRDRAQRVARAVDALVLRAAADSIQVTRRYELLPVLAAVVTDAGAAALRADAGVADVQADEVWRPHLAEVAQVVGSSAKGGSAGVTGVGVRVAVIDSGIDAGHADLAGRVVAQQCFAWGACPPSGASQGTDASDSHGHGTHVASIVGGQGKVASPGIAPGAQLVAVRVTDKKGRARLSDILAGLDWVAVHAGPLGIRIVNVSLGGSTAYKKHCDGWQPATAAALALLAAKGVAVFAAAGNDGAPGVTAPGCLTKALAVGATYDASLPAQSYPGTCAAPKPGSLACFSNRGSALDLLAPGARVQAAAAGGGTVAMSGTSQASPVAAAVAALVLSCQPKLSLAKLRAILGTTGKPVAIAGGTVVAEVRAAAAVQAACGKAGP